MARKPLTKQDFDWIYSKVPRLCVEVVVQTAKGIVLTMRSIDPFKGYWHLPGGTVLFGESLEDAVAGVAKEELGVDVQIIKMLGVLQYNGLISPKYKTCDFSLAYLVKIVGGTLRGSEQGEEIGEFTKAPEGAISEHVEFLKNVGLLN